MASGRLEGLDVARFLALVGMVFVNFDMVMTGGQSDTIQVTIASLFQGRAAATFVVLAGLGLGLTSQRKSWDVTLSTTLKRAVFLFVLGMLNAIVFPPDIIHFYAVYFLFAAAFLRAPGWLLWAAMTSLILGFVTLTVIFNYDAGWDWSIYEYDDFWSLRGFLRNLLFNGWHPVVPWLAFILFSIWLSRLELRSPRVQLALMIIGAGIFIATKTASLQLIAITAPEDPEAAYLFGTEPVPPMPLYMISGAAFSATIVGLCLKAEAAMRKLKILYIFTAPGRQTLTLYIAHILIGMGTLEALGMIGTQSIATAQVASLVFCAIATVFCLAWTRFFTRGPLEIIMRRVT